MSYLASEQDNPPKTADCLKKIDTSSKFLLSLINDVLDMSKAESNKITFHLEPYSFLELDNYIDSLIRPLCQAKDQKLIIDASREDDELSPLADKLRINQILFNLLSNAVKYTPEGGTIHYQASAKRLGNNKLSVSYLVQDNGIGMSQDFQKNLFQPFMIPKKYQ